MAEIAPKLATYEDLRRLPDAVRAEIIHGQVVLMPSARARHGLAVGDVSGQLRPTRNRGGGDPPGWWIVNEVDVEFDRHEVYRPDIAGWQRSRMPKLPDELPITVLPDWVFEVLSPSNQRNDRIEKMSVYRQSGVPFAWLVDPQARFLEAFENVNGRWVLLGTWGDGHKVSIAPFAEVEMDVGTLFEPSAQAAP